METPPILSPNLEIDQSLVAYEDLQIQGSFGRKQTYPNDQVPTISTIQGLDTDNKPRVARLTPDGHVIVHPDVSSGGDGGGGLWTPKSIVGVEASSFTTDDIMVFNGIHWKTMTTVYAMDVYIEMTDIPQASSKNRNYLGFTDAIDHDPLWWAFAIFCGPSPAGIGGELPYNTAHFDFGTGLNISDYLHRPLADGIWVQMNNKQAPVHAIVTLYGD